MPEINFTEQELTPVNALAPEARTLLMSPSTSRSQKRIQEEIETQRRQLEASGMNKPATIINFNPVPLLQDGLIRMTVAAAGTSETGRVEWEHNGHIYVGHSMTIRTPLIYASTEGSESDPDTLVDTPQQKANYLLPIGIAYSFFSHYSGNAKDSSHMGGILIYEGDRHTLSPKNLEHSEGMILVPEPVPLPRNRRSYRSVPRSLTAVAAEMFEMQSMYADYRIQAAHSFWTTNDPMQQKQITDLDRTWARFAMEHGMIEELPEWVRAKVLSGAALANVVRCPVCSKPRQVPGIFLCPDCRAPYDAFEAFMAGAPVPEQYIDMLDDEKLELVMRERVRRENRSKLILAKARKEAKEGAGE